MLSRVADSLYWLGRYIERAENYARFIRVNNNLSLDLPPGVKEQWAPLVATTGDQDIFDNTYSKTSRENVIFFLAFDKTYENSIVRSVEKARENARIIRESISKEAWETLNDLHYFIKKGERKKIWQTPDPREFFQKIMDKVHILNGLAYHTESRTEGWYFNKIGQYVERADKTSRILDVKYHILLPSLQEVGSPIEFIHWAALLKSVDSFNAFKHVYGKISPESVLEFLMLNRYFPRSVFFSLSQAEICLHEITGNRSGYSNVPERSLGALRSELEFMDIRRVIDFGVHEFIDQLQLKINEFSETLSKEYFQIKPNIISQTIEE